MPGDEARDPLVSRALRELPVPEHRLTFWADLDAAVAEAASSAAVDGATAATSSTDTGPRRPDTDEVPMVRRAAPRATRPRRLAPWLAAAAGLLVVVGGVGFVLSQDGGDDAADGRATTIPATSEPPAPETTVTTLAATTSTAVTTTAVASEPAAVAQSFIDALGSGDTAAALALLGPRSTAYIESLGGDPLGFVAEMQEGYGAWAGADDVELSATSAGVVPPLESELSIVTVQGTYPGEGEATQRVDAFPMVRQGDGWVVELVALADGRDNRMRFTLPPIDSSGLLGGMAPTDEINVFVPTQGTVLFQLDGGEIFADQTADIPAGVFSLYAPPAPLGNGTHTLVAVAVGADGTITPFGGTFTVEG